MTKWDLCELISIKFAAGREDNSDKKSDLKISKKRQLKESSPKSSKASMPLTKRPRTVTPNKFTAIKSDVMVLSSDDDTDVPGIGGLQNEKRRIKQRRVIKLCPLSRPGSNCKRCKVDTRLGGKRFSCHCSAKTIWLSKGRVGSAEAHWTTDKLLTSLWFYVDLDLKTKLQEICNRYMQGKDVQSRKEYSVNFFFQTFNHPKF